MKDLLRFCKGHRFEDRQILSSVTGSGGVFEILKEYEVAVRNVEFLKFLIGESGESESQP
jgi:hypothetical protein